MPFLSAVVSVVLWTAGIICYRKGWHPEVYKWIFAFASVSTMLMAFSFLALGGKRLDERKLSQEASYYRDLVAVSELVSPETRTSIISDAKLFNMRLEENRKNKDSFFTRFLYSETIASLEPIVIPSVRSEGDQSDKKL